MLLKTQNKLAVWARSVEYISPCFEIARFGCHRYGIIFLNYNKYFVAKLFDNVCMFSPFTHMPKFIYIMWKSDMRIKYFGSIQCVRDFFYRFAG